MSVQLQNMLIVAFLALLGGVILKIFGDAWSERSRQRLRCSVQWFDFESLNRQQLEDLFKAFDVDAVIPNGFFVGPRLFRVKLENPPNNEACEIELHIKNCLFYQNIETKVISKGQDRKIINFSLLPSRVLELVGAIDGNYGDISEKIQILSKGKNIRMTPLQFRRLSERDWSRLHFIARNSHWFLGGFFIIINLILLLPAILR